MPKPKTNTRRPLARMIEEFRYRRDIRDVFGDFAEMAALALSNKFDLAQHAVREERYLTLIKQYQPEERTSFAEMLGELGSMLRENPEQDALGAVAIELSVLNKGLGQIFTPYDLSALMAALTIGDPSESIGKRGFITVCDPCCGAGSLMIAAAMAVKKAGHDYQRCMHVTATDIDRRCVHMAYVQLSLLGIPAEIVKGNTLTLEVTERWYTPAHILGGWSQRLGSRDARDAAIVEAAQDYWASMPMADRIKRAELAGMPPDAALVTAVPPALAGSLPPAAE